MLPPENPLGLEHTLRFQPAPTQAKTTFPNVLSVENSGRVKLPDARIIIPRPPHVPTQCPTKHSPDPLCCIPKYQFPIAVTVRSAPACPFGHVMLYAHEY